MDDRKIAILFFLSISQLIVLVSLIFSHQQLETREARDYEAITDILFRLDSQDSDTVTYYSTKTGHYETVQ